MYVNAVSHLFETLGMIEIRLSEQHYLLGLRTVETDWRLCVTLIRFNAVYHGHFKGNICRIVDYPNLFGYLKDLYQVDGVVETVNFDHIKRYDYITHDDLNPTRLVLVGPYQYLYSPHGRALRR